MAVAGVGKRKTIAGFGGQAAAGTASMLLL